MKVLVTGGAGFIGSRSVLRLLQEGHECVVLDNLHPQVHTHNPEQSSTWKAVQGACRTLVADVRDEMALEKALEGCDAVLHLAAETGTGQSMYEAGRYSSVNVTGTAILLQMVARRRDTIRRFVVASSRAVYGEGSYLCVEHGILTPHGRTLEGVRRFGFDPRCPQCLGELTPQPTTEVAALSPASVYAVTKLSQEQLVGVVCASATVPWLALRYQNVYGPGQSLNNPYTGVLSIFSRLMMQQADLEIFEDGLESRDFIYVDDVIAANMAALAAPPDRTGIVNVGSGAGTPILRLVQLLGARYGYSGKVTVTGRFRAGDIRHNVASSVAARDLLGFSASVKIEEGVAEFCAWAKNELASAPHVADTGYLRSLAELEARGLIS
jgi:dTDP-L-rhamnose 4-epimerase